MMNLKALLLGVFVLTFGNSTVSLAEGDGFNHDGEIWSKVLSDYTDANAMFAYKKLVSDLKANSKHPFNTYLTQLQAVSRAEFDQWSRQQQMAFLINAYNAFTVKLIVDHYPVKSIREINVRFLVVPKPWDLEFFSLLGGEIKSIDPIEHEYLRPIYKDYRIHAAVNCASISCPPLRREAFVAERLDEQMNEQMRLWINDESRNKFNATTGEVSVSKIFDPAWYGKDFADWGEGVPAVLKRYGSDEVGKALDKGGRIRYLPYDWGLNSVE